MIKRKFKDMVREKPMLFVLCILLFVISLTTINSEFYLLGWDNFSSYFNLKTNIFRTLFATWREYRGLGVASDAEVTDVFRQIIFWIWRYVFLIPENLLDQLFYILALWVGVLGIYGCARIFYKDFKLPESQIAQKNKDLFGFLAAFFYLFNLNTLSVFYSPIIPFINRFFGLPLTVYVFLRYLEKRTTRNLLLLIFVILFTSGSYITPTIFITSLLAFFIFLASRLSFRQVFIYCFIYLCINAFWILPFLNYTFEKSSVIPLARTFTEINESLLNRPLSMFSWENQTILRPSFIDTKYPTIDGQEFTIHPLFSGFDTNQYRIIYYLFPVFYVIGGLFILIKGKKLRTMLWVPIWILLFLFFSMKEASPLAFFYTLLKNIIPYFSIIFRIGDTKFHAYISFAGSLAAAYVMFISLSFLFKKRILFISALTAIFILVLLYVYQFRTFFTGNLISPFAYTVIPKAYFDIAKEINSIPGNGRVLHLPMDNWQHYWRSFSWGYIGSAFFNYLIDKPYIDKTFEPASLENSYLHAKLTNLVETYYRTWETEEGKRSADDFLSLLQKTGIQFVLLDESINPNIYTRNTIFSAKQPLVKARTLIDRLYQDEKLILKNTYPVNMDEIYPKYERLYPVSVLGPTQDKPTSSLIYLFEVPLTQSKFSTVSEVQNVDPNFRNLLETQADQVNINYIQDPVKPAQFLPFKQQDHSVENNDDFYTLTYDNANNDALAYTIGTTAQQPDSNMIDIYGQIDGNTLTLTFYHRYYPTINGIEFKRNLGNVSLNLPKLDLDQSSSSYILSNWPIDSTQSLSDTYRLLINDIVIPIPRNISGNESYVSTVILHDKSIRATLLTKVSNLDLNLWIYGQTDPINCYGPQLSDYQANSGRTGEDKIYLNVKGGSACVRGPISLSRNLPDKNSYAEFEIRLSTNIQNIVQLQKKVGASPVEKIITEKGELPVHAYICIHEGLSAECLNSKKQLRIPKSSFNSFSSIYRIPIRSVTSNLADLNVDIGLVNPSGTLQTLIIESLKLHQYGVGGASNLAFDPRTAEEKVTVNGSLKISIPKAVSPYSYYHHPTYEYFSMPSESCRPDNPKPRIARYFGDTLVNLMENCGVFFAEDIRFAFGYPYFFVFEYWIGSGSQPHIILKNPHEDFLLELVFLNHGYPTITNMKQLQDSQLFDNSKYVVNLLNNIPLATGSRLIDPIHDPNTSESEMTLHIHQDTQNTGILAVNAFDMVEIPASWQNLTITPNGSKLTFPTKEVQLVSKRILPSFWKIRNVPSGSVLLFNEGFDRQWKVYESLWALIIGEEKASAVRCNGYANCFVIPNNQLTENESLYVFYRPELLAFAGWGMTAGAIGLLIWKLKRRVLISS